MRFAALLAASLIAASASADPLPKALAEAAKRYDRAQLHGDRAGLELSLAPDYRLIQSNGTVESRADFIAESSAPTFHLEPFTIEDPVETVWSSGAALSGIATLRGTDHGKPFTVRIRFTDVWALRAQKWQVVLTQVTHLPTK